MYLYNLKESYYYIYTQAKQTEILALLFHLPSSRKDEIYFPYISSILYKYREKNEKLKMV